MDLVLADKLVASLRAEVSKIGDLDEKLDFLGHILDELDGDYVKLWDVTGDDEGE